jgi:L-seryl-tRNA(Ser) seleniumtransferase
MDGPVDSRQQKKSPLSHTKRIPFVEDIGGGAIFRTEIPGVEHGRRLPVLRQGADLICFSGDKLLGGPKH